MADSKGKRKGTQTSSANSDGGRSMPRSTVPERSLTLQQRYLGQDASVRPEKAGSTRLSSPSRKNSSGESYATGYSDPKAWFDRSNRNPPDALDDATMDVDPPFFHTQSDVSNDEMSNPARDSACLSIPAATRSYNYNPTLAARSSSAEDYRSVIDDLTIENKRLKDELKRYKQFGSDILRKDKLFEIKYHSLPSMKRKELEATLRDFAASLEGSMVASSQRKKSKYADLLQASSSNSKHASSSSSQSRPVDSAYASMSAGPSSTGPNAHSAWLGRPSARRSQFSTDRKVASYLQDIPEGFYPRHVAMTDKDRKKLVVRRLEQIFTGRASVKGEEDTGRNSLLPKSGPQKSSAAAAAPHVTELSREARILGNEPGRKRTSRDGLSKSNTKGEAEDETGESCAGSGVLSIGYIGNDNSPTTTNPTEQRATRPLDLDPDRVQIPVENMQYIRHLGMTAPEHVCETKYRSQDVSLDAEGWIPLNLLCNLAQLHMYNVTPNYIRSAVSERSTKFQLSMDGRKIRWRGGTEGTTFSSDSSGNNSQRSPEVDTTSTYGSNSEGQRKKQKTSARASAPSSQSQAKLDPQSSVASERFQYKPLFIHNRWSSAETSVDDTTSQASFGAVEQSNPVSRSTEYISGSASSPRKRRRHDGTTIYYSGAPFCTDLSGDPGDLHSPKFMTWTGRKEEIPTQEIPTQEDARRRVRTLSGSSLPFRPLVDGPEQACLAMDQEPELVTDDTDLSDLEEDFGFTWSADPDQIQIPPLQVQLEPCGLGGVTPEDHFAVLVISRHSMNIQTERPNPVCQKSDKTADSVAKRIGILNADLPRTPRHYCDHPQHVNVQIIAQKYRDLKPLPLPPPAMFYPPFTETTESEASGFEDDYVEEKDDSDAMAYMHEVGTDLDRFGTMDSNQVGSVDAKITSNVSFARASRISSIISGGHLRKDFDRYTDSSGATAGGAVSSYGDSRKEDR